MPNVREVFPNLEKLRRAARGHKPKMSWTKSPSFEQVIAKLAPSIFDSNIKTVNSHGSQIEMQRYILRNGNNFGYLCFKTSGVLLDRCKSYDELQRVVNGLEQSINWSNGLARLVDYVSGHCTSPTYINRVRQLRA